MGILLRFSSLLEKVPGGVSGDVYAGGKSLKCGYVYDSNGNMIKDMRRGLELSYNCLNLLTEVRRGGRSLRPLYSAFRRHEDGRSRRKRS